MTRLPTPGSDDGNWGAILNDYLVQSHKTDGTIKDNIITEANLATAVRDKVNAVASSGATNLSTTAAASTVTIASDTGSDATVSSATTSTAGVLSATDKTKLDGIAAGATVNSTDATLLNRANHTGAQATSTVTGLDTALSGKAPLSHTHVATDITSGTVAAARLGSGTANNTSFLRGDGTWAVPSGTGGGVPTTYALGRIRYNSGWPATRPTGYAYIDWIKSGVSDPDPDSAVMIAGDTITDWS